MALRLPEDYRRFLSELGNGGAGPSYGVFPLGHAHLGFDLVPFDDWGFDLSQPFPHTEAWNDDGLMFEGSPDPEAFDDEAEYETALQEWRESEAGEAARDAYFDGYGTSFGAVPICHHGCGVRDWLIVTGPEAGNIWHDMSPDECGIEPVTREGHGRTTFAEWYLDWLERSLRELGGS